MVMAADSTKGGETRVLLVEPDPADLRRFVGALGREGWVVAPAADAASAQAAARRQRFDVAVADAQCPGGGVRVLRRLRTALNTAVVPAVALADSDDEHAELTAAGAQICLTKPVTDEALVGAIREARGVTLAPERAPAHAVAAPDRLRALLRSRLLDTPPGAEQSRRSRSARRRLCRRAGPEQRRGTDRLLLCRRHARPDVERRRVGRLRELAAVAQAEMAIRQVDSPQPEQLARGVTGILRLLATCGSRLGDDERDGLVKLGEAHVNRLAGATSR